MNPICFFHRCDLDGVCSGAIVKRFVPECEMHGFDYGDEFPWDKVEPGYENDPAFTMPVKRTVYMVDVSLPIEDMRRLAEVSNLVYIDHHKTAIAAWMERIPPARFFLKEAYAACEMCWAWFNDHTEEGAIETISIDYRTMPEAVRLLGRYDVWDKDDPDWATRILPFQYAMRSLPGIYDPTSLEWLRVLLFKGTMDRSEALSMLDLGDGILRFQAEQNRAVCADCAYEARLREPEGIKLKAPRKYYLLCLNTPNRGSQNFDSVWDPERHDIMCAYATLKNGMYRVSLYSTKPDIDCGAICKMFGGGGHKGAAGFVCYKLPWEAE